MQKPIIRTIHHLSCSGGSVLCKCIASMQNAIVISEVHPDQLRFEFNPYDPTQLLLAQTNLGEDISLRRQIFLNRIIETEQILKNNNMITVLRDHTHSDYLIQNNIAEIISKSSLIESISGHFEVYSVLSIRNPIDSYLSLIHNKWNNSISSFEDYCSRILLMLKTYEKLGALIIKYEDFCKDPDIILKQICRKLVINYSADYAKRFYKIPMTGDSGRLGRVETVKVQTPRKMNEILRNEIEVSKSFMEITKRYSY